jgi:NitT/TauT family transport system permease protein
LGLISTFFFPAPTTSLSTAVRLIASGELVTDLAYTLYRLSLGLVLGGSLGLALGLLMGWSRAVRDVAEPFVAAIHPLPKISLLPLLLVILGIGEQSKVLLTALAAFFPMLINSMAGVRQIEDVYWEVASNYGARGSTLLRRVILPGSLPMVLAGVRLALNSALVVTIAVELLTARQGLGARVWLAWETFRTEELYATLAVVILVGLATNWVSKALARRLAPWQPE